MDSEELEAERIKEWTEKQMMTQERGAWGQTEMTWGKG